MASSAVLQRRTRLGTEPKKTCLHSSSTDWVCMLVDFPLSLSALPHMWTTQSGCAADIIIVATAVSESDVFALSTSALLRVWERRCTLFGDFLRDSEWINFFLSSLCSVVFSHSTRREIKHREVRQQEKVLYSIGSCKFNWVRIWLRDWFILFSYREFSYQPFKDQRKLNLELLFHSQMSGFQSSRNFGFDTDMEMDFTEHSQKRGEHPVTETIWCGKF